MRRKAFEKARNIFPPVDSNNTTAIIEFPQYVKISVQPAWPAVLLYERSSRVQNVGLGHHGQGKISITYTEEKKRLLDGETETARSNLHKNHKNNSTQSKILTWRERVFWLNQQARMVGKSSHHSS